MRLLPLVTWLFSSTLSAQSVLTTSYNANYFLASLAGGVYFDLDVHREMHLDRLDLNLWSPASTQGAVEVFVRPGTWFGHVESASGSNSAGHDGWVLAASGTVQSAGPQLATPCVLQVPIGLSPGTYGIAVRFSGVMPMYSFAFGARTFANPDLALTGGGSAVWALQSAPFYYRIFSGAVHYTLGGGPYFTAEARRFGAGCQQGARSFYEAFAPASLDLAGQRIVMTPNTHGGYDIVRAPASPVVLPANRTNLGLVRGGAVHVLLATPLPVLGETTTSLFVLADGRVMLTEAGLVNTGPVPPSPPLLLSLLPTIAAGWMDLQPDATRNVYSSVDPVSGSTTVTWWNVPNHGVPGSSNTFAFTAYPNGTLEVAWGAIENPADTCIIGFGAGGTARDPGPRDLSVASAFATQHDDRGLGITAFGRPVLGTTTRLVSTDVPTGAIAQVMLFDWQALVPGIDLGPQGAPECQLYVAPANVVAMGPAVGSATDVLVPPAGGLLGLSFHCQAVVLAPGVNALGLVTSNGIALCVGGV